MRDRLRAILLRIAAVFGATGATGSEGAGRTRSSEERERFWSEFRAGQREADAGSRRPPELRPEHGR